MENFPADTQAKPEIVLFDRSDKGSVICMIPERVAANAEAALQACPELFQKDEQELYKFMRENQRTPTPTDNRLRLSFWLEYDRAKSSGKGMVMSNVTAGVCSRAYFEETYMKNHWKVSWLLIPPTEYSLKMTEALEFGIEQMRDILNLPNVDDSKRLDYKLMDLKRKVVESLHDKVKGATVQKIETKNLSITASATPDDVRKLAEKMTTAEMEAKIRELTAKDSRDAKEGFIGANREVVTMEIKKNVTKDKAGVP